MPVDINAISPHAATDYIIPQMTAFFVDCFTADSKRRANSSTSALIFPRIVRAPISAPDTTGIGGSPDVKSEVKAIGGRTAKGGNYSRCNRRVAEVEMSLAAIHSIVKAHGGLMSTCDPAVGNGSVRIYLPKKKSKRPVSSPIKACHLVLAEI